MRTLLCITIAMKNVGGAFTTMWKNKAAARLPFLKI